VSVLLVAALALAAALAQVGPLSLLAREPMAAPLLPVALVAGWGVGRLPGETWPVLLVAGVVFGAVSEERVGLFVLALAPAAVFTLAARAADRDPRGLLGRRLAGAAAAAAAGALVYGSLLAIAGGHAGAVPDSARALATGAALTALLAAAGALVLWPWRPRPRGLFE